MKKHLCIVAAAALAVGGMGLSSLHAQDAAPAEDRNALERAADSTGEAVRDAGEATGDAARDVTRGTRDTLGLNEDAAANPNAEEIHDVLAQVTEAAATKGGLDDMVERFVDADRNRLGQNQDALKDNAELDGTIAQLHEDWKAKYNQDFDIADEKKVFGEGGFAMIREGEIGEGARTAGERLDTAGRQTDDAVRDSADTATDAARDTGIDAPRVDTSGDTAADRNLNDPGRNIATVTIAASHGKPEVKVPMIHEAGGWKLDIPDSMDAAKFRDSVKEAMSKVGSMKAEWPADPNEAYRAVSHEVLAAIFADGAGDSSAQPAGFGSQPDAGQGLGSQPNAGQDLNRDPAAPATPAEPATPAQPQ